MLSTTVRAARERSQGLRWPTVAYSQKLRGEDSNHMREVAKEEFKRLYFEHGGGAAAGWGLDYWNKFFPDDERTDMKHLVEKPATPERTRMMIVTDASAKEHRLFFLTEEAEESFFELPD